MFIVWGKKPVYRTLGYVADFCPICRCPKPFLVRRIGMAGHVYYITAGEGELVGYDRTCQECKTPYPAEPNAYKTIAKKQASLPLLINETFPNLVEVWGERLAIEQKIRSAPSQLSAQERQALVGEPFYRLSPKVEARFASTHLDKEVGFAAVGAIALLSFTPGLVGAVAPDQEGPAFLTALVVGLGLVIWQMAISGQRWLRREILPTLSLSLVPLNPSERELDAALSNLKRLGHKIGAKLRPAEVLAHMKSHSNRANGLPVREG